MKRSVRHSHVPKHDDLREQRIATEIVVDAYGAEERAMSWFYYLDAHLEFPFTATSIARRATSRLEPGDEVVVVGMPPEDVCEHEMFVRIRWGKRHLAVPLAQLKPVSDTTQDTIQAVADWHYWVRRGYGI